MLIESSARAQRFHRHYKEQWHYSTGTIGGTPPLHSLWDRRDSGWNGSKNERIRRDAGWNRRGGNWIRREIYIAGGTSGEVLLESGR